MSFCRISSKAKNHPKPNFFPIIPPISLAHARKLCRITGKRIDKHKYVSLLETGKRPACVRNKATGKNTGSKQKLSNGEVKKTTEVTTSGVHSCQNDFKYVTPVLDRDRVEEEDFKVFEALQKLLETLKSGLSLEDKNKTYVYLLNSTLCGLMLPAEMEEAIRKGDLESVSLSKSYDKAIFKIRGKPTFFLPLREVDVCKVMSGTYYDGKGQNKDILSKQKQVIENRKRRTLLASIKIFEDREKQAAEEILRDLERPVGKTKVLGLRRTKRARIFRDRLSKFKETYLSINNMSSYGEWKAALRTNVHQMNWERIKRINQLEIDTTVPSKLELFPLNVEEFTLKKRIKNVYVPDEPGLEIVPYFIDTLFNEVEVSAAMVSFIENSKKSNFLSTSSLKSMFANEEALKVLPNLSEFQEMGEKFLSISKLEMGCMYDQGDGIKYATDSNLAPTGSNIVTGAIFETDSGPKFIPGEIIGSDGEKRFLPGQKMSSVNGEFIPGASLRANYGQFQFIPGLMFKKHFTAGQFVQTNGKTNFVKGQVIQTLKGSKFVEGETTSTPDGLKLVAG